MWWYGEIHTLADEPALQNPVFLLAAGSSALVRHSLSCPVPEVRVLCLLLPCMGAVAPPLVWRDMRMTMCSMLSSQSPAHSGRCLAGGMALQEYRAPQEGCRGVWCCNTDLCRGPCKECSRLLSTTT